MYPRHDAKLSKGAILFEHSLIQPCLRGELSKTKKRYQIASYGWGTFQGQCDSSEKCHGEGTWQFEECTNEGFRYLLGLEFESCFKDDLMHGLCKY